MPRTFFPFVFVAFSVASCLLSDATVLARDIYVNNRTGHDGRSGYQPEGMLGLTGPVRTIRRALELARSGDRIVLEPTEVPFYETITLARHHHGGTQGFPFVIEGNGAILDGTRPLPPEVWEHVEGDLFRFLPPIESADLTYFQIYDRSGVITCVKTPPAQKLISLQPREWTLHGGKVYFMAEANTSPCVAADYDFVYTHSLTGVTLLQVDHVRIHDLTVQGFQIDGISAFNNARVILDNVICRNNGRAGLSVGGASRVAAGYCTFTGNLESAVLTKPHSSTLLHGCICDPEPEVSDRLVIEEAADGEPGARPVVHAAKIQESLLPMPEAKRIGPAKSESPTPPTTSPATVEEEEEDDPFDF